MDWMTRPEIRNFFGITDEEALEELVIDHDLDVILDEEGRIEFLAAEPEKMREALFSHHERTVGHRPDDPVAVARAVRAEEDDERKRKTARMKQRGVLARRVAARREP